MELVEYGNLSTQTTGFSKKLLHSLLPSLHIPIFLLLATITIMPKSGLTWIWGCINHVSGFCTLEALTSALPAYAGNTLSISWYAWVTCMRHLTLASYLPSHVDHTIPQIFINTVHFKMGLWGEEASPIWFILIYLKLSHCRVCWFLNCSSKLLHQYVLPPEMWYSSWFSPSLQTLGFSEMNFL